MIYKKILIYHFVPEFFFFLSQHNFFSVPLSFSYEYNYSFRFGHHCTGLLIIFQYFSKKSTHMNDVNMNKGKLRLIIIFIYININKYIYINKCVFVCMFEVFGRLNGWTDFLEIFTVSSCMSGRLLFMLKFQKTEVPHPHILYYLLL